MRSVQIRLGLAALAIAGMAVQAVPTPAAAATNKLVYAVLRDGSPVGRHSLTFTRNGTTTDVDISTRVAVKMAFITVYRFEHDGHETWRGNNLVAMRSQTNDDGTHHRVEVSSQGDHLQVAADGNRGTAPASILPASLWEPGVVRQSELLNTLDGKRMRVAVKDMGQEAVKIEGQRTAAHHYKMSGGLDRDLWFGPDNTLVRMQFAAKDGSTIVYELQ
ncbi:MAG: DUF6134 family protein [Hyphomicrobiaceae bacterium]